MLRIREAAELAIIIVLVVACHVTQKMEQPALPAFDKEGHRGCRGLMPENTIPAMLRGVDLGVTTLEMDACITKDYKVILSHEPFFNHDITTKPDSQFVNEKEEKSLNIYGMTYAKTQQYDVGMKVHPRFSRQQKMPATKPLLEAVIDSVQAYIAATGKPQVFYNIETKTSSTTDNVYHPVPDIFVDLLMDVLKRKNITAYVIIQSFDFRTLKILHQKYPAVRTAALIEEFDRRSFEEHLKELGFTPTIYSPAYILVNKELIDKCHKMEVKVIPWTVNDKNELERLKALGVDGIITDYPDLF